MSDLFGQVDLVFVIDSTGSMGPFIQTAREEAKRVIDQIEEDADLDIRIALVAYRDHPPQDNTFVVDVHAFGDSGSFKAALDNMRAMGGGDHPEAVLDGLLAGATMEWRANADKVMYLVGDAPAHGIGMIGDAFAHGCPCRCTPGGVVEVINAAGIRLNVISLGTDVLGFREFADACRGSYVKVAPERMEESMAFTSSTLSATATLVGSTRAYAAASSTLGTTDPARIADALGWSKEMASGTMAYAVSRGITPEMMAGLEELEKE